MAIRNKNLNKESSSLIANNYDKGKSIDSLSKEFSISKESGRKNI